MSTDPKRLTNVRQVLLDARLNAFAVDLLCESLLRSPIAAQLAKEDRPLKFYVPMSRGDCQGWAGVDITLKPWTVAQVEALGAAALGEAQVNVKPDQVRSDAISYIGGRIARLNGEDRARFSGALLVDAFDTQSLADEWLSHFASIKARFDNGDRIVAAKGGAS